MLAKAVDALSWERSLKHKIETFSKSYMEEKKKLDFHIRRDNIKMSATQNMIN
jgi:hypothetical protein